MNQSKPKAIVLGVGPKGGCGGVDINLQKNRFRSEYTTADCAEIEYQSMYNIAIVPEDFEVPGQLLTEAYIIRLYRGQPRRIPRFRLHVHLSND